MSEDISQVKARLNQLMSQQIVQSVVLRVLCGSLATLNGDWRDNLDTMRMMSEWSIKNLDWEGDPAEGQAIRLQALDYLKKELDELHLALLRAERTEPPP